jgi:hypothetical protein
MAGEGRSILFWVQFGKCTVRRIGSKPWEISNRSLGGGRLGLGPCQGVIPQSPVAPFGRIERSSYERLALRLQAPPLVRLEQAIASEVAVAEATEPGV